MSGPGPAQWAYRKWEQRPALDIGAALETLRRLWPDKYMFGHDPDIDQERPWWASQGDVGSLLRAASPQELNQKLTALEEGSAP